MVTISFDKHTLSNGLDVILHEDHTIPLVAVNVWYHVGSKDEEMGRTGFAHLFEHVMFEGSKHHRSDTGPIKGPIQRTRPIAITLYPHINRPVCCRCR